MQREYLFPYVQEFSVIQTNVLRTHTVNEIGFNTRVLTIFAREHVQNALELLHLTVEDLEGMVGIGKGSISNILSRTESWLVREKIIDNQVIDQYRNTYIFSCRNQMTSEQVDNLNQHWIKEAGYCVRVKNILLKNGIQKMGEVVSLRQWDMDKFRGFGISSYQDLYSKTSDWLKENHKFPESKKEIHCFLKEKDRERLKKINEILRPIYPYSWNNLFEILESEGLIDSLFGDKVSTSTIEEDIRIIFTSNELKRFLKNYFANQINDEYEQENAFKSKIAKDGLPEDLIMDILISQKICICQHGYVFTYRMGIDDYLNHCITNDRLIGIFKMRLEGKTLQVIADKYGMTKQRVDQLVKIQMGKFPPLIEDYYKPLFDWIYPRYRSASAKEEAFLMAVPGVTELSYSYLKIRYGAAVKFDHLLIDPETYDGPFKENLAASLKRNETENLELILKRYASEHMATPKRHGLIRQEFSEYLKTNYSDRTDFKIPPSYTFYRMLRDIPGVVRTKSGYYRFSKVNIKRILDEVDFLKYQNQILSAKIIYADNKDLMEDEDIHDGFELHSILRTALDWDEFKEKEIHLKKIPMLTIGDADEEKQVFSLYDELKPVSQANYFMEYQMRYGYQLKNFDGKALRMLLKTKKFIA